MSIEEDHKNDYECIAVIRDTREALLTLMRQRRVKTDVELCAKVDALDSELHRLQDRIVYVWD